MELLNTEGSIWSQHNTCWELLSVLEFFQYCVCFAVCSSELNFQAAVSSGQVSGQAWCAGDSDEYQWITLDFGGEKIISGKQNILPSTNTY